MKTETSEMPEGLRSMRVMTRNLPTIQLEEVLVNAGYQVEYSAGLMLITKPDSFQPKREIEMSPMPCGCRWTKIFDCSNPEHNKKPDPVEAKIAEINQTYGGFGAECLPNHLRELVNLARKEK